MTIHFSRAEIERMRIQIRRQQKEILALQRLGISTASDAIIAGADASERW
jgi:hypothetical protein